MTAKSYLIQYNLGKARYAVSFHNGDKKHDDGSDFYDLRIFKNKKALNLFIVSLKNNGYIEQ